MIERQNEIDRLRRESDKLKRDIKEAKSKAKDYAKTAKERDKASKEVSRLQRQYETQRQKLATTEEGLNRTKPLDELEVEEETLKRKIEEDQQILNDENASFSFSTAPFAVERGVRQGDPLSAYLFIMVLEILCISIRGSKDIQGINVDTEEIKLELFADDLTGFLRNDHSLKKFMELVETFGECSGLRINHEKSEVMLLGNSRHYSLRNDTEIGDLKIKHSVKILGVHFSYDLRTKRRMNFDEIVTSIKQKLHIWRWRDLTIIGRIQIVKTFIIPIFLYRASMICSDQEFIKEVNKIIFDFIWKGRDKFKRSVLVGDIEDGGLRAPHLKSMIETQRIICCKKLASDEPSSWKTILLHYLKPVGGKLILCCNFDVKMLPIKLPPFYEDCLNSFAKCSVASYHSEEAIDDINAILQTILWNNKLIRIDGKAIFFKTLAEKGILRIGDLISERNELITKSN